VGSALVVAIDGPSGSGKSTIGRALAEQLGLEYLDTGAMYRAVAWAVLDRGIDLDDDATVAALAPTLAIEVRDGCCTVDGTDVSDDIRGAAVTGAVSAVAANPEVRRELVARQRRWISERGGGVVEGRDIGSVVWPDARLKVYLTADLAVRAARRAAEVAGDEQHHTEAIRRRDHHDSNRAVDPLTLAGDALVVDTTERSVDEIVRDLMARL
jgi:cytidylate kinase